MPENDATQLYEGMFLLNPAAINSSVATATQVVQDLLGRAEAQVEALYKWDDRKLAYEIENQKRGLYMLAYFRVRGVQVANIERDVNLSEQVMRCLILRADHIGQTELELATEKQKETRDAAALEKGGEEEAAGEQTSDKQASPPADTAQSVEGSRDESAAAASSQADAPRPTPSEGEGEGEAPEAGTKATENE